MNAAPAPFPGGRTLAHHKAAPLAQPIVPAPRPRALNLPLHGYAGEPEPDLEARLQVQPGQRVVAGELLLAHQDDAHPALHAPLAGVFTGLHRCAAPTDPWAAAQHLQIEVATDAEPVQPPDDAPADLDLTGVSATDVIEALKRCGVVGLGGARFPTAEKVRHGQGAVETLIINGVGCEPYIACDEALMYARPRAIILGARLLARALAARRIVIALEDPVADAHGSLVTRLNDDLQALGPVDVEIDVVQVPERYPQGAERQLIQTLTGQAIPHHQLPQSFGLLVSNVATAASAFDATIHQRPLTHRVVTVTGPAMAQPMNVYAPIGSAVADLIELAGGRPDDNARWVLGGPLSGQPIHNLAASIDKGSLCVLGLPEESSSARQSPLPCINCGFCVSVCPAQLLPQQLFKLAQHGQHTEAQALGMMDCIECGLCAEVCPSHLPLVDAYRHSKDWLRAQQRDERAQQRAKRRFDARQARIEKQQSADQARRQARAERLQSQAAAQSEIEAALARARAKKTGPHSPTESGKTGKTGESGDKGNGGDPAT